MTLITIYTSIKGVLMMFGCLNSAWFSSLNQWKSLL